MQQQPSSTDLPAMGSEASADANVFIAGPRRDQGSGERLPRAVELSALESRVLYSAAPVDPPVEVVLSGEGWAGDAPADPAPEAPVHPLQHLILIDSLLADCEGLAAGLAQANPDSGVVILGEGWAGIGGLEQLLGSYRDLGRIDLLTHGDVHGLFLGPDRVDLGDHAALERLGLSIDRALADGGELLLFGCDLAGSAAGRLALDDLARLAQANLWASTDLTGDPLLGGNWTLEFWTGGETDGARHLEPGDGFAWQHVMSVPATATSSTSETSARDRGSGHAVAMHTDGSFVVVWSSDAIDGNGWGVAARRFAADGTPLGSEFQVNQYVTGDQRWSSVGMDSAGNFVVSWTSEGQDGSQGGVYARRFWADGTARGGEFLVNSTTSGIQQNSSIAVAGDGSFVVVWEGNGAGDSYGIFQRRFSTAGAAIGGESLVHAASANNQYDASISMNAAGQYAVVWDDANGFHAQRFLANGAASGSQITASSSTTAGNGAVLLQDNGDLVVTWRDTILGVRQTFLRVYDTANATSFLPVLVNSLTTHSQTNPSIHGPGTGGFMVVWEGASSGDTSDIYARRFEANGSYDGGVFRVNDFTAGVQHMASLSMQSSGEYAVVWSGAGPGNTTGVWIATGTHPLATGGTLTLNEDSPRTILAADLGYSDPENDPLAWIRIESVSHGTLLLDGNAVSAGAIVSAADLTAGRLVFQPLPDANGLFTTAVSFRVSDGWTESVAASWLSFNVAAVNDAPAVTGPVTATVTSGREVRFSGINAISVDDVDHGGGLLTVSLSATHGVLTLGQLTGLSLVSGTGSHNASMVFSGTLASINAALDGLVYTANSGYSGLAAISIAVNDNGNTGTGGSQSTSHLIDLNVLAPNSATLWITTSGDRNYAGGIRWRAGEAVSFGAPGLAFEPGTTSGTFSAIFDVSHFAQDGRAGLTGLHYVSSSVSIGTGAYEVNVQRGDVLFSVRDNETFAGQAVSRSDLLLFRPDVPGDYGSGSISVLLRNLASGELREIALVERAMEVGGIVLNPGELLFVESGGGSDNDVYRFAATTTGNTPATGVKTLLIDGGDAGLGSGISGLDLVQTGISIAGFDLTQGELLISLQGSATVGSNNVAVGRHDIFVLNVNQAGAATAAAARLMFQGSDVGLTTSNEALRGLTLVVTNYAPLLTGAGLLDPLAEDQAVIPGVLVADFLSGIVSDPDGAVAAGLAVTGIDNTHGDWQFSTDGGLSWQPFGMASDAHAWLLAADGSTRFRFVPVADWSGTAALQYRAWDQTVGMAGSWMAITSTGGVSAFSAATGSSAVLVAPVNDAPVLDGGAPLWMDPIDEDEINNSGQSVGSILAAGGGNPLSDVDAGALRGIAIVASLPGNGVWQYSINGGLTWTGFGAVSNASALLLRETDRVRFVPDGIAGTMAEFTFRGWDQTGSTTGQQGAKWNIAATGGSSPFSAATRTAAIAVADVNDEQVLAVNTGLMVLEGAGGNTITPAILQTVDVDHGPADLQYVLTTAPSHGWLYRGGVLVAQGEGFSQADIDGGLIQYVHDGSETSSDGFGFVVDDGQGASTAGWLAITVIPVNSHPPTIVSNGGGPAATVAVGENSQFVTRVEAVDPDLPAQTLVYTITGGADAGLFFINPATGDLSFRDAPDYEDPLDADRDGQYEVIVSASDGSWSAIQSIFVQVTDVNEFTVTAPVDVDASVDEVHENAAVGTAVGITARSRDLDGSNNGVVYSLTDSAGGRFGIDPVTGVVFVADGSRLDAEDATRHRIVVRAASADGSFAESRFWIEVRDVNEQPVGPVTDADPQSDQIPFDAAAGTLAGITARAIDPDLGNAVFWSLDSNGGGQFEIDPLTGVVRTARAILALPGTTFQIVVRASSTDGSFSLRTFSVIVGSSSDQSPGASAPVSLSATGTVATGDSAPADSPAPPAEDGQGPAGQAGASAPPPVVRQPAVAGGSPVASPGPGQPVQVADTLSHRIASDDGSTGGKAHEQEKGPGSVHYAARHAVAGDAGVLLAQPARFKALSIDQQADMRQWQLLWLKSISDHAQGTPEIRLHGQTAVTAAASLLAVGYLTWAVKGSGALLGAFVSSMPAWQQFDPLVVIESRSRNSDDEDESIESMVESGSN